MAFSGDGKEYFGIWLNNIFLSIVTAGIYSAWAKVRNKQYFLGHTKILGDGFGYHATGMQILKGRLVVLGCLAGFTFLQDFLLMDEELILYLPVLMILFFFVLYPWAMNKSLAFSARMTSWRTVRFKWHGTFGRTFVYYTLAPYLVLLSFGLAGPWVARKTAEYFVENHSLGTRRLSLSKMSLGRISLTYFLCIMLPFAVLFASLVLLLGGVVLAAVSTAENGQFLNWSTEGEELRNLILSGLVEAILILFIVVIFLSWKLFRLWLLREMLRSLQLPDVARFTSFLDMGKGGWIIVSNLVLFVLSLGVATPWLMVRYQKYLVETTGVVTSRELAVFVSAQQSEQSAIGEGFTDFESLDFGVGL
ncbi:YjgN family protein [Kiloniella sp. b19]|uniref:YjgN family protein n=1 Tax=Kiloniella sp. GXU_MW_B19 TaxID=3141326 RepID=UPI0031CE9A3B